jgi:hypothetical protein
MRDVGALTLALVVVLVAAAIWTERRLVQVTLAANLTFTVPHFVSRGQGRRVGDSVRQDIRAAVAEAAPASVMTSPGLRLRPAPAAAAAMPCSVIVPVSSRPNA